MRWPRRDRYDVVAVLAAHGVKLRARQEAAAAELAAEREASARLETERQRQRDEEWIQESRSKRENQQETAPVLMWPKGGVG